MMKLLVSFLLAVFSITATAHDGTSHDHGLLISDAWAPHTGKRTMSAAIYLKIHNQGAENDALIGVRSKRASMSMLHESKEVDGIMQMDHVDVMPVPAGKMAELQPGHHHIMLMQLTEPLKRGDTFRITLAFEEAGDVEVIVDITGIGGPE
jgi:copper(I)-binding protein